MYFPDAPLALIIFALSILSISLAWTSTRIFIAGRVIPIWSIAVSCLITFCLYHGFMRPIALLGFFVMGVAGYSYRQKRHVHISRFVLILVGFALAVDALPGFTKILLLDSVQVSAAAVPFTLDINLAKLGAGLIILVTVFSAEERRLPSLGQIKQSLLPIFITICITLAMSSVFLIDFDPKLSPYLLLFILSNIFIAVITEEAFFRGLIYKPLANVVSPLIAVIITGILFGLAHFGMGRWDYILVASVAGCGYGYLFMKTGRLAMPVITHFSLNLTHFVMFTYPFLPFVGT